MAGSGRNESSYQSPGSQRRRHRSQRRSRRTRGQRFVIVSRCCRTLRLSQQSLEVAHDRHEVTAAATPSLARARRRPLMSDWMVAKVRVPEAHESRQPTLRERLVQIPRLVAGGRTTVGAAGCLPKFGVGNRALGPGRARIVEVGNAVCYRGPAPLGLLLALHREPAASARSEELDDVDETPPVLVGDVAARDRDVAELGRPCVRAAGGPGPGRRTWRCSFAA